MRVLMLGWEFPPHISGGLGTACEGLTRGLASEAVDLTFVVPRAFGDEDTHHLEFIGLTAPPGEARPAPAGRGDAVRVLAVDSMLRPYLDEAAYRALLEAREIAAREVGIVEEDAPLSQADGRPAFEGGYGENLMDEVARYADAVAELARHTAFDLVHAHDWMTFPAGVAASKIAETPLVVHVHASEYDRSGDHANPVVVDIERMGIAAADRIVAVSRLTAGVLQERYGADADRIRVVHNAVTQEARGEREAEAKAFEDPIVLFLGRVTFQKGPEYFIEASRRVVDIRPDVRVVMSGSGDMLPGMIEHAARIGIGRNVHFTGFLQGEDVERMYELADLYVMPSVSEPFGITPLEAMRLDTPVIVSRQSGVSEVLENVLKVDFWDIEDLANKILAVLERPALRQELRREGLDEVRALRWEHSAARLRQVYEEVLA